MTLHWWMHWFWITRAVAAATVLLLLLPAAIAAPFPPSTLHPDIHNSASALPPDYQEKSSSIPSGQPEDAAVYEVSPVWTSSPEIEEPFYPTTVPSNDPASSDIPQGHQALPWAPKTHVRPPVAEASTRLEHLGVLPSSQYPNRDERLPWSETDNPDTLIEPRALPLEAAPEIVKDDESQTIPINPNVKEIQPKILRNYSSKIEVKGKDELTQLHSENTLSDQNTSVNIDPINEATSGSSEYIPRLVPRDLRNVSELSSDVTSHGNNSTSPQIPHAGIRQNVRTSKSIGFFPSQPVNSHILSMHRINPPSSKETEPSSDYLKKSSGEDGQSSGEKEDVSVIGGEKTVGNSSASAKQSEHGSGGSFNVNVSVNKERIGSVDSKVSSEDLEMSDSPYTPPGDSANSSVGSHTHTRVSKQVNSSEGVENKKNNFGNGNSKISSDNHTKTNFNVSESSVNVSDITVSDKAHVNNKGKEVTPLDSTLKSVNGTSQSKKSMNGTQILNQTHSTGSGDIGGVSTHEGNSSTVNDNKDSMTYPASSVLQVTSASSGNITPTSNRADFGRSASHNYANEDDETTSTISVTPVSRVAASPSSSAQRGLDAASITGIALGIVVFAGLTGAISFVLYRRRYLNKPQTLNDKCSNPDSSGYIDDSTLRENSEEMYSLDNDSFLNSLEAMTIQNYWTDNVKHTKL